MLLLGVMGNIRALEPLQCPEENTAVYKSPLSYRNKTALKLNSVVYFATNWVLIETSQNLRPGKFVIPL